RVDLRGLIEGARQRLEAGFDDVVRVASLNLIEMQIHADLIGQGQEEVMNQLGIEITDSWLLDRQVVGEERASAQVDDDRNQCFVERPRRVAEAADAVLFTERLAKRFAERQPDIFDGVMLVDVEVALGAYPQVEEAVPGKDLEHMIEERHARLDLRLAAPIDI